MAGRVAAKVLPAGAVVLWCAGLPAVACASAWGMGRVPSGSGWMGVLLFIGVELSMLLGFWWLARNGGRGAVAALLALNLAWLVLMCVRIGMRDDQAMHDRGVTEQAVVTERIHTSDLMSGVGDKVTAVRLALPSGGVARLELKGDRAPAVGESVRVTRDPLGRVPVRRGPRPEAPDGTLATIALVVVIASALVCAAAVSPAVAGAVEDLVDR